MHPVVLNQRLVIRTHLPALTPSAPGSGRGSGVRPQRPRTHRREGRWSSGTQSGPYGSALSPAVSTLMPAPLLRSSRALHAYVYLLSRRATDDRRLLPGARQGPRRRAAAVLGEHAPPDSQQSTPSHHDTSLTTEATLAARVSGVNADVTSCYHDVSDLLALVRALGPPHPSVRRATGHPWW